MMIFLGTTGKRKLGAPNQTLHRTAAQPVSGLFGRLGGAAVGELSVRRYLFSDDLHYPFAAKPSKVFFVRASKLQSFRFHSEALLHQRVCDAHGQRRTSRWRRTAGLPSCLLLCGLAHSQCLSLPPLSLALGEMERRRCSK